jgi:hypothetical protein
MSRESGNSRPSAPNFSLTWQMLRLWIHWVLATTGGIILGGILTGAILNLLLIFFLFSSIPLAVLLLWLLFITGPLFWWPIAKLQWSVLRRMGVFTEKTWMVSAIVGGSVARLAAWAINPVGDLNHAAPLYVEILGGAILGLSQAWLLRRDLATKAVWVFASALGWASTSVLDFSMVRFPADFIFAQAGPAYPTFLLAGIMALAIITGLPVIYLATAPSSPLRLLFVSLLAVSSYGMLVAVKQVSLYRYLNPGQAPQKVIIVNAHDQEVDRLHYSSDGTTLFSNSEDEIATWEAASGALINRWNSPIYSLDNLVFFPHSSTAAFRASQMIFLLNLDDFQTAAPTIQGELYFNEDTFSPDETMIAYIRNDTHILTVREVATGKELFTKELPFSVNETVVFSPDSRYLAFPSADSVVLLDLHDWSEESTLQAENCPDPHVEAFSPDGRKLVTTCNIGISIWSIDSASILLSIKPPGGWGNPTLSADGVYLAAETGENRITVRRADTGEEVRELRGHEGSIRALTFSPSGDYLASGDDLGIIRIWDLSDLGP